MLFLLFRLGPDRYALDTSRVVEVVPLLELKRLPHAPKGVAGLFNYHGQPVPALDLSEFTLGTPARERLSTRIIIVRYPGEEGTSHLLGLIAEHATEMLRRDASEFAAPGLTIAAAPYLGPVLMAPQGPIQFIDERCLLSEPLRRLLFAPPAALSHGAN